MAFAITSIYHANSDRHQQLEERIGYQFVYGGKQQGYHYHQFQHSLQDTHISECLHFLMRDNGCIVWYTYQIYDKR